MSFPVYYPVQEGDIRRGIKSPQIGGHSLPCSATNAIYGIEPFDTIKEAFEKLFPGGGPGTDDVEYVFTSRTKTPASGVLYLEVGEVNCRTAGVTAITNTLLTGLSIRVDAVDGAKDFDVEVVTDPSAAVPSLIGALTLSSGNKSDQRNDLSAGITAGSEWGVRITRKTGAGRSDFSNIVVVVRLRN